MRSTTLPTSAVPRARSRRALTAARLLLAASLLLSAAAPGTAGGAPLHDVASGTQGCPDPRTCPSYTLARDDAEVRWPADADGITRIPFFVNPVSAALPRAQAVELALLGARTWEAYLPTVRLEYRGETLLPAVPGDGVNVIQLTGAHPVAVTSSDAEQERLMEFDILLDTQNRWQPCDPFADGSCTDACPDPVCYGTDLQWAMAHELGHALGLGHADADAPGCELTMGGAGNHEGCTSNDRKGATLGLGDVLGVHQLYPFSCPDTYQDAEEAARYRLVCPTIRIFWP